jgi:hypothetical protein
MARTRKTQFHTLNNWRKVSFVSERSGATLFGTILKREVPARQGTTLKANQYCSSKIANFSSNQPGLILLRHIGRQSAFQKSKTLRLELANGIY